MLSGLQRFPTIPFNFLVAVAILALSPKATGKPQLNIGSIEATAFAAAGQLGQRAFQLSGTGGRAREGWVLQTDCESLLLRTLSN